MTAIDFLEKIKAQKAKAHDLLAEAESYDIRRGMGHSISGFVEDLFATYIATNIGRTDLIYFVDKVVSYRPDVRLRAKSFKPDLLILNKNKLIATHYYDLKTDIGYSREMKDNLRRWNDLILSLRGSKAWITVNRKREYEIQFTDTIKYSVVIAIDWNVNPDDLATNQKFAEDLEGIDMYVLLNKKPESDFRVHQDQFNKLLVACKQNML